MCWTHYSIPTATVLAAVAIVSIQVRLHIFYLYIYPTKIIFLLNIFCFFFFCLPIKVTRIWYPLCSMVQLHWNGMPPCSLYINGSTINLRRSIISPVLKQIGLCVQRRCTVEAQVPQRLIYLYCQFLRLN